MISKRKQRSNPKMTTKWPIPHFTSPGKMVSRISQGTAGKGASSARQKFVIRHLADSKLSHLQLFFDLATECTVHLTQSENILKNSWPIGKLLGTLQTLNTIIKHVNWAVKDIPTEFLSSVLATVIKFGEHSMFLMSHREQIKPGALRQIKDLRTLSILTLEAFSQHAQYTFSTEETGKIMAWLAPLITTVQNDALDKSS